MSLLGLVVYPHANTGYWEFTVVSLLQNFNFGHAVIFLYIRVKAFDLNKPDFRQLSTVNHSKTRIATSRLALLLTCVFPLKKKFH